MNYSKLISDNNNRLQDMSKDDLTSEFMSLLTDETVVRAIAQVLQNKGKEQLEENLMYRHKMSLMSNGESTLNADNSRNDLALLGAISAGQVLSNLIRFHDCKSFSQQYK